MLNSGNEPKDLLKRKELAFFGAKNELVFECKRTQKRWQKAGFCVESKSNSRVERGRLTVATRAECSFAPGRDDCRLPALSCGVTIASLPLDSEART